MATIRITISDDEKKRIDQLFKSLGMTISSATKIFYSQSLHDNGLPFRPKVNKNNKATVITPTINDKGELVLPDDVPDDVREWVENG